MTKFSKQQIPPSGSSVPERTLSAAGLEAPLRVGRPQQAALSMYKSDQLSISRSTHESHIRLQKDALKSVNSYRIEQTIAPSAGAVIRAGFLNESEYTCTGLSHTKFGKCKDNFFEK